MSLLAVLSLALLSADVSVTVAPDQPLPFVYVDDPLVIELLSPEDVSARVKLRLKPEESSGAVDISLGDLMLTAGAPRWCAIKDAPRERGCYTAEVSLEIRDAVQKTSARFCRIDRMDERRTLPVFVDAPADPDKKALLAYRSVGVRTVRLDVSAPDMPGHAALARQLGLACLCRVPAGSGAALDAALPALLEGGNGGARWDVRYDGDMAAFNALAEKILKVFPAAVLAVELERPELLSGFLAERAPRLAVDQVVVGAGDAPRTAVIACRSIALAHGMEGWRVDELLPESAPADWVKTALDSWAEGAGQLGVPSGMVFADGGLTAGAACMNGLSGRLEKTDFIGEMPLAEGVRALLFRDNARWMLACWSNKPAEAVLPLEGVVGLETTDMLGNPSVSVQPEGARLTLATGPSPWFVSGIGGVVPGGAARARANTAASELLQAAAGQEALSGMRTLVSAVQSGLGDDSSRGRFLELVRHFPKLEAMMHGGQLPAETALPVIARLAELARALCLIEDDRGEPFLEPISDTISRCEEQQSLYLTGSTANPGGLSRGEWLLGEVRRLVGEAEALEAVGRRVEASAVAALAEWRAQGLAVAARAPAAVAVSATQAAPPAQEAKKAEAAPPAKEKTQEAPQPAPEAQDAAGGETIIHVVRSGDNPSVIAAKYKVSVDDLLKWNNWKKNVRLNIGDKVTVRAKGGGAEEKPAPAKSAKGKRSSKSKR